MAGLDASAAGHSRTLERHLIGYEGFSTNLAIRLTQEFGVSSTVANSLVRTYGGRARDVLVIARDELGSKPQTGTLVPGYPYIEAEVIFAAR